MVRCNLNASAPACIPLHSEVRQRLFIVWFQTERDQSTIVCVFRKQLLLTELRLQIRTLDQRDDKVIVTIAEIDFQALFRGKVLSDSKVLLS